MRLLVESTPNGKRAGLLALTAAGVIGRRFRCASKSQHTPPACIRNRKRGQQFGRTRSGCSIKAREHWLNVSGLWCGLAF
jgi:hypothetical protein